MVTENVCGNGGKPIQFYFVYHKSVTRDGLCVKVVVCWYLKQK